MEEIEQYPLGDNDIRTILGNNISILNYPDLENMESADEMFDDQGRCVLLFPTFSEQSGHWTALIDRPDRIEFFDSYGGRPESQKAGLGKARLKKLDIDHPDLTKLLRASGKPVYYNPHKFQELSPMIGTCGRHCCVRLLNKDKSLDQYYDMIKKSGINADDYVSKVTYKILGK